MCILFFHFRKIQFLKKNNKKFSCNFFNYIVILDNISGPVSTY